MFGLSMFLNALLFVPQAMKIYKTQSSAGVSLITFAGFNVIQLFTMLHGYINRDFLLMFGFAISFVACGVITVLVFRQQQTKKNHN
jgi:MtN3 and saliva related transmembrane protein